MPIRPPSQAVVLDRAIHDQLDQMQLVARRSDSDEQSEGTAEGPQVSQNCQVEDEKVGVPEINYGEVDEMHVSYATDS